MCGINGYNWNESKIIKDMNKSINHRGPDDSSIYFDNEISFGQVRLSILDLSNAGRQPMFYNKLYGASNDNFNKQNITKSPLAITFNGEIYNYIEIREELKKNKYKFSTDTDTEVILAAYHLWGEECVKKFNGMWAFVIYDKKNKTLFCSRDRLGVKPFYYYEKDGKFIFSSEIKGILQHKNLNINTKDNLCKEAVQFYFTMNYIPAPYTIYKDIKKLYSSHNMIYDLKKKKIIKIEKYYEIPKLKPLNDKKRLIKEGRELLKDSVKLRMRSDVPVGAFLSGGLDSSTVVGVMKEMTDASKLHTFSIGFEGKKYDETPYINIIKNHFKTNHHHYYFKEKDFSELLKKFVEIYDEPFGDYSGFPTYKVSSMTKKHVSVCLSGDGGDEIFAGYNMHLAGARMDFIRKIPKPIRWTLSKMPAKKNLNDVVSLYTLKMALKVSLYDKKDFYARAIEEERYRPQIFKKWSKEKLAYCLKKGDNKMSEALRIHDLLFNTLADYFLVKVDRASMQHALEVRSPFLDYRFIEFAQKIPSNLKTDIKQTKILMREIIKDILPEEITNRGKQGFTPPVNKWIINKTYETELKSGLEIIKELDDELYKYFKNKVMKEKNMLYNDDRTRLYIFNLWFKRWIK